MNDITRSEAIKQLRLLKGDINYGLSFISKTKDKNLSLDSLDMAIKSLETDEAYQLEYESTTKNSLAVDAVAVSRQALIDWLKNWTLGDASPLIDFVNSMPPVTPIRPKSEWEQDHAILKAYSDGVNEVLDKIRAEMLEEMLSHSGTGEEVIQAYADGLKKGLEFIDKYKVESEE